MARASALHAEGQRFDSVILHQRKEHTDILEARWRNEAISEENETKSRATRAPHCRKAVGGKILENKPNQRQIHEAKVVHRKLREPPVLPKP